MIPTRDKSKLLRICFVDGTQIGDIHVNGPDGTYLQKFRLYGGHAQNKEVTKIRILKPGINYTGFNQGKYLATIQKGLSRALGKPVEFREKTSVINAKRLLKKRRLKLKNKERPKYLQVNKEGYVIGLTDEPSLVGLFGGNLRNPKINPRDINKIEKMLKGQQKINEGLHINDLVRLTKNKSYSIIN